jgi:hypothetical protein
MISRASPHNCSSIRNNTNPCNAKLSYDNNSNNRTINNHHGNKSRSSNCYRPLQHLYKTIYSPTDGNNSSQMNLACICHPLERYKTANMTYGSFHYNNWAFMQKNRPINTDRQLFARCYDNNNKQPKINTKSNCNNRLAEYRTFFLEYNLIKNDSFSAYNTDENQYWRQTTSDTCCPTDCCKNTT